MISDLGVAFPRQEIDTPDRSERNSSFKGLEVHILSFHMCSRGVKLPLGDWTRASDLASLSGRPVAKSKRPRIVAIHRAQQSP